jgi:GNAT superfamily N-acetyltransferase
MIFPDLELSRRLERAEGHACMEYATARRRLFPESGADWMQCGGAYVVFDGIDSPLTQTFGLGIFEDLTPAILDRIEQFYRDHGSPVFHEVSPYAGIAALDLLCRRNYRPVEISNVLFREVQKSSTEVPSGVKARVITPTEAQLWSTVSAAGWAHEHPELMEFLLQLGTIATARPQSLCFFGEIDGKAGAAGALSIYEGGALFAGSSTIPELRRRGLQTALMHERMHYACNNGCDLAMMVAETGGQSQRNAERRGFTIAYTRTKWRLYT